MNAGFSPIVRRRRLGAELRELREREDLTLLELAGMIGCSSSKISRLENARVRPDIADVIDILDALGTTGTQREQIIALARDATTSRGWWHAYTGDTFERQHDYAELEHGAVDIREFQLTQVPGLLQTREYAMARFASRPAVGLSLIDPGTAADARMARQAVLERDAPLEYRALLDESALVRRCGPHGVRGGQFGHLAGLAERPNITLRILPYDASSVGGYLPRCSFSIYRFADPCDPEIVVVETETSDLHLGDDEDVERYKLVFDLLWNAAFSPEDTINLLKAARDDPEEEL